MDQSNGDTIIGNTNHLTEVFSWTIFLGVTREGPRRPVMARVSPPPDLENPSVTISHPWLPWPAPAQSAWHELQCVPLPL